MTSVVLTRKCIHSLARYPKSWPEISKFDIDEVEADRQRSKTNCCLVMLKIETSKDGRRGTS